MTYTKASPEWRNIMRENTWFSPDTMAWWNCVVLWDTLKPVGDKWLFLSLDDTFDRTERKYSVRCADLNTGDIGTLSFQETSSEAEARSMLYAYALLTQSLGN